MKPAAFYILPSILLVALIACSNTDDPINYEDLLGVVWSLDSLQTPDTTLVALGPGYATIQFTDEMVVRGHSTKLVSYHGIYELAEDGLLSIDIIEPAELGCDRPSSNCIIIDAFEQVTTHKVSENRLRLFQNNQYAFYFHSSLFDENLLHTTWKVDSLLTPDVTIFRGPDTLTTIIRSKDTVRVAQYSDTYMTFQFTEDMRVGGIDFCNGFGATYEITETGIITIDVLTWTEMVCPDRPDGVLRYALENVTAYDVVDSTLALYEENRYYVVDLSPE